MMKRLLCMMAACLLVWTMVLPVALADEGDEKSGDFTYRLKGNGTAVITGYEGTSEEVFVPRMVDGYIVTEIGENAFSAVESGYGKIITLPDTITVIGDKAFEGCKASVINIPDSVQSIGDFAFQSCENIQTVSIPASVERIGTGAFARCSSIRSFYVDSQNAVYATINGVLFNKQKKELVAFSPNRIKNHSKISTESDYISYAVPDGIESIGAYAFAGIEEIGDFKFADTVKTIGDHAFANVKLRQKIEVSGAKQYGKLRMPTSLEYIDNSAFIGADLGEVVFGSELKAIGDYAFCKAKFYTKEESPHSVRSIILPASIQSIGKGAFKEFKGGTVSYFDLSETHITALEAEAFSGVELVTWKTSEITLPPTLKEIKERAFENVLAHYISLQNVEIIGEQAFRGGGTASISVGTNLKEIDDQAFYNHHFNSQENFYFPNTVTHIGTEVFKGAAGLKRITIPASVEKIGDGLCDKATVNLEVEKGSYAAQYASENGYQTIKTGNTDTSWLNN